MKVGDRVLFRLLGESSFKRGELHDLLIHEKRGNTYTIKKEDGSKITAPEDIMEVMPIADKRPPADELYENFVGIKDASLRVSIEAGNYRLLGYGEKVLEDDVVIYGKGFNVPRPCSAGPSCVVLEKGALDCLVFRKI